MKVSFFIPLILLLPIFGYVESSNVRKNLNSLTIAFKNISHKVFQESQKVIVVKCEDQEKNDGKTIRNQIIDGIKEENIPFQIYDLNTTKTDIFQDSACKIVLFASIKQVWRTFVDLKLIKVKRSVKFSIETSYYFHILNATVEDIEGLHRIFNTHFYVNAYRELYFVIDEPLDLRLLTFSQVAEGQCRGFKVKLIELNRFSKKLNKWLGQTFAVKRAQNFHSCKFSIYSENSREEAAKKILKIDEPVQSLYYEMTRKLFEALSTNLNFTLVFDLEGAKDVKTSLGAITAIGYERNMITLIDRAPLTRPYLYQNVYVAVPVGEKVSDFEKLLLPFDPAIWIWICLTFFAAFSTIFVLRFQSEDARNLVTGHNVSTPALNILIIFFGLSNTRLPEKFFARFLLMLFIMYSLIIRTAWQGKMFEFLQKDLRKPEMKSIADLKQNNFTLYMDDRSLHSLNATEFKKSSTISYVGFDNILANLSGKLSDPKFKGAVQSLDDVLKYQAILTNGTFLRRILKETIYVKMIVMMLYDGRFHKAVDEKIGQLWESGIIDHFNLDYNQYVNPKRYDHLHPEGPEVLTLEHLRAGFVIWLVSVAFAMLSFVGEWIARMMDLMIVHSLFTAFYDMKRSEVSEKFHCLTDERFKNSLNYGGQKVIDKSPPDALKLVQ